MMSWKRLNDVLKTFLQDVLKTSSEDEDERPLQDAFIKSMFVGKIVLDLQ